MSRWARRNDHRLITGHGSYVGDVNREGQLWLSVVRSSHAAGRIVSIDTSEARAHPGVHAVLTAADVDSLPRIPVRVVPVPGMDERLQPPFALDVVRYVGEPIVAVVADDPYIAEDAADLVTVEIEPTEAATGPADKDGPLLWDDGRSNVLSEFRALHGDVDEAFAKAAVVVTNSFRWARQSGMPMETRGLVAEWEPDGDLLHIWGATKFMHHTRRWVANFFGLPHDKVITHGVDVGGMFGVRGEVYPEDFIVPFAAKVTGRPVKWVEDRREHLVTINQSRDHRHTMSVAAAADGTLLGFKSTGSIDVGAYPRPIGGRLPQNLVGSFPGPYRWQAFDAVCQGVASNKTPHGTMRAPSSCEAIFVMERSIDMVARELGMDPLELRQKNLIKGEEMPLEVDMGDFGVAPVHYDSGDYPEQIRLFLEQIGYDDLKADVERRRAAGELVGIGLAMFVDHSGMGKEETVGLTLSPAGKFVLGTSSTDFGQGLTDMAVKVLSSSLAVDPDDVEVFASDSTAHMGGNGTFASRATIFVGSAAMDAAGKLEAEAARKAATILGSPIEEIERTLKGFRKGNDSVHWKELAPIEVVGELKMDDPTHGLGVTVAVVSIDREVGAIKPERLMVGYDVGTAIDVPSIMGQLKGGGAMGIGNALFEAFRFDDEGQPLSTSFIDYVLPTCAEMPRIDAYIFEMEAVPSNPLGAKGAGEAGIKGIGASVSNAVADALGNEASRSITTMPIRPDDIAELIPLPWMDVPEPAAQPAPEPVTAPAAMAAAEPTAPPPPAPASRSRKKSLITIVALALLGLLWQQLRSGKRRS